MSDPINTPPQKPDPPTMKQLNAATKTMRCVKITFFVDANTPPEDVTAARRAGYTIVNRTNKKKK